MNVNSIGTADSKPDFKQDRAFNFFWIGYSVYILSWTITTTSYVNFILYQSIQLLGFALFLPSAIYLMRWQFENTFLRVIFQLYVLWTILVLLRGFSFNYQFVKYQILDPYDGILVYFAPFALLFPMRLEYIRRLFIIILLFGLSYVILDMIYIRDIAFTYGQNLRSQAIIEYFSKSLSLPCGFILVTYIYHSDRRKLFALFIIGLTFIFALMRARRALMFLSFTIFLSYYLFYFSLNKGLIFKVLLSFFIMLVLVAYGASVYSSGGGMVGFFKERQDEDTRTLVEECMKRDMTTVDWIIGKGINGSYYCPGIDGPFSMTRPNIETDYLCIILKGGIISLSLYLLMLVPAVFKGFFRSKNYFVKGAAAWILIYISCLYPIPVTDFSLNYLLVWISVGICFSPKFRNLSDEEIFEKLSLQKKSEKG
jgi:hypothetical protein